MSLRSVTSGLVLSSVVLIGGTACPARPGHKAAEPPAPPAAEVRQPGRPLALPREPEVAIGGSLAELRERFAAAYRLPLDRRITRAFDEARRMLLGEPPRSATRATFAAGRWQLAQGDEVIGSLSPTPDLPESLALLGQWVRRLHGGAPLAPAPAADPHPAVLLDHRAIPLLEEADRRWSKGERSGAVVAVAARALCALAFEMTDHMELGDALPARALAATAMLRDLAGARATREEALLAEAMGYHRAARAAADALEAADPLRWYVARDDERLRGLAQRPDADAGVRYLWLRRLARRGDEVAEQAFRRRWFQGPDLLVPALSARLRASFFTDQVLLPEAQAALLLFHASRAAGAGLRALADPAFWADRTPLDAKLDRAARLVRDDLARTGEALAARFEAEMQRLGLSRKDHFLGGDGLQTFHRALFYSALKKTALFYTDKLNSTEAAARFARALGEPRTPYQRDFARWYQVIVQSRAGQAVEGRLFEGLRGLEAFGGAPLLRLFDELQDQADWGDPGMTGAVKRLVANLDTRPAALGDMANLAYEGLGDLRLAESLARRYVELTDAASTAAWLARRDGDVAAMKTLLARPDLPPAEGGALVRHLTRLGALGPEDAQKAFRSFLAPAGDDWSAREELVEWLHARQEHDEERAVIRAYLDRRLEVFNVIRARQALARSYRAQDRPREGLATIAPVAESQHFGASSEVALLRLMLGDRDGAVQMAELMSRRYPGAKTRAFLAEIHWRAGEAAAAARALAEGARGMRLVDWAWQVGARFAAVFAARPPAEGLAAFEALAAHVQDPFALAGLAGAVGRAGHHELAFQIWSRLRAPGLGQLEMSMRAYRALKAWKGEQPARQWLEGQVPPPARSPLSMFAFSEREDGLLWDLVPDPSAPDAKGDFVWLMRAAAFRRAGDQDPRRAAILRKHFEGPGASHYHAVGRYLLGVTDDETAVLALVTDSRRQCEVAFYLGLRAQAEGRYEEASDWYRASIETGSVRDGEYRWATDLLAAWKASGLSLARLRDERR